MSNQFERQNERLWPLSHHLSILLAGVSYVISQTQQTEPITYSDVFTYFTEGKVDQYKVDDSVLTMHLRDENRVVSYDLAVRVISGGRSSARRSRSRWRTVPSKRSIM